METISSSPNFVGLFLFRLTAYEKAVEFSMLPARKRGFLSAVLLLQLDWNGRLCLGAVLCERTRQDRKLSKKNFLVFTSTQIHRLLVVQLDWNGH